MATLEGYTVQVEALQNRDLDQQEEALAALPRVNSIEFCGVPGGGSYFRIEFCGEMPRPIEAMLRRCDSVVRGACKGEWVNSRVLSGASRRAYLHLGGYVEAGKF